METRELKIQVPEGYEIDKEKSTFENIVFKKKEERRWRRDDENALLNGYYISFRSNIIEVNGFYNVPTNRNIFATEKQAKSALAMARISQIMANDERFGGPITDEEWDNNSKLKYLIVRDNNRICFSSLCHRYHFLAFHTREQCDLFFEENEDLVKDYLMID